MAVQFLLLEAVEERMITADQWAESWGVDGARAVSCLGRLPVSCDYLGAAAV